MKAETLYLIIAILFGLIGQSMLNYSEGFTKLFFTINTLASYFIAFAFLALAVKKLPLSIAYAIWGGVGTAMSVVSGKLLFNESFSIMKLCAVALIVAGIVILQSNLNNVEKESAAYKR